MESIFSGRAMPFTKKNSLFLKKSNARFFQKQAVFLGHRQVLDFQCPEIG
jgi:hypothetical protein